MIAMMQTFADLEALSRGAADLFAEKAREAAQARGRFSVALSGGSTPKRTYELLATAPWRDQIPWGQVHVFWGDERCVSQDDPRSNYRMTRLAWLDHVPIPQAQVHPILTPTTPQAAAAQYEAELKQYFGQGPPRFDLVLLGMGTNAHTASLFPGTPVLKETKCWAAEVYVAEQDLWRVTLTAPLLNQAAVIAFIVSGADKGPVMREVIEGPFDPERLPSQLIRPESGDLRWLVDAAAGAAFRS
jgi:6-phosphogluconolactonase